MPVLIETSPANECDLIWKWTLTCIPLKRIADVRTYLIGGVVKCFPIDLVFVKGADERWT